MKKIGSFLNFLLGYTGCWLIVIVGFILWLFHIWIGSHLMLFGVTIYILNILTTIEKLDTLIKDKHIILIDKDDLKVKE